MHRDLCDFLMEIVQNSLEAGGTRITVDWIDAGLTLDLKVRDNGRGMTPEEIQRLADPYFTDGIKHAKRKAGLGIPFLAQALEMTGGAYSVESEPGEGTLVSCTFKLDHIDTPPQGTLAPAFMSLFTMNGAYELTLHRVKNDGSEYEISRSQLTEALGELETAGSHELLRQYLESCEEDM